MRATITEVHLRSDKRITVEFDTCFGSAKGVWLNKELPVKGQDYDFEVDIFDQLYSGEEITLSQNEGFRIAKDNDNVIIQGLLEGSLEDNTESASSARYAARAARHSGRQRNPSAALKLSAAVQLAVNAIAFASITNPPLPAANPRRVRPANAVAECVPATPLATPASATPDGCAAATD